MKVKPLNNGVVVLRRDQEERTAGGIIIPDTAKDKPMEGVIVDVGPGRCDDSGFRLPMQVKPGDRVLLGKYSGSEVQIDGREHLIVPEDEILAIIEE